MAEAERPVDEGGGGGKGPGLSYSDKLKVNVRREERLKRNVLEIHLENDSRTNINLDNVTVANLCSRIGIDLKTEVEGVQVMPGNSRKIFVWVKDNCNLDRFCLHESIRVAPGVKTGLIKPMDKKEVAVTIKGLNFNTPDPLVIEYLNKHGKVVHNKVIYETEKEGPFMGIKNGNRKYLVDFSHSEHNLGSFHIIDGANTSVFFLGQKKTCGRCYRTANNCPGRGFGKKCEENSGERVKLIDHMREHWKAIGFAVESFKLDTENDDEVGNSVTEDVPIKDGVKFSPPPKPQQKTVSYIGIVVKNLPKVLPDEQIKKFLHEHGLPECTDEYYFQIFESHKNKNVDVEGLNEDLCKRMIESLNEKVFFDQKVYCRGLTNLNNTPTKCDLVSEELENTPNKSKDNGSVDEKIDTSMSSEKKQDQHKSPKTPTKQSGPSHIPGLSQEDISKAAKKAAKKERRKEAEKQAKKDNEKGKVKLVEKTQNTTPKDVSSNLFEILANEIVSGNEAENSENWTWEREDPATKPGDVISPNQLIKTPALRSLWAKKVEKEEMWKQALEMSGKRPATSPPEIDPKSRARSTSGIPRLDFSSQQ